MIVLDKLRASWLKSPHAMMAAEALGADHMRFVGGAVRDSLMNLPISDIDVATDHLPDKAMELLKAKGFRVIPTGIEHGTVTAILESGTLEVTTLRRDIETDGRRAVVAFTDEWQADAARRDFTINAIYASIDGTLYDPYDGIADIEQGCVRFIGKAEDRIREDALRILRLFRFHAHYGRVALEDAALLAVENTLSLIGGLSVERIASELNKLIIARNPIPVLKMMQGLGVLECCMRGYALDLDATERLIANETAYHFQPKALRRLLALVGQSTTELMVSWNCSKKAQNHATMCEEILANLGSSPTPMMEWEKLIYKNNHEAVIDCYLILNIGEIEPNIIEALKDWDIPIFPIRGSDMLDLGYEAGPELGKIMKDLEEYWFDKDFEPSFEALIGLLRK